MTRGFKKAAQAAMLAASWLPQAARAVSCTGGDCVSEGLSSRFFSGIFGGGGLSGARSLPELIMAAISMLLFFAGAIAVLFVIIGGFWYITSAGNEEQAEKGRNTLVNAIIGVIVIVLSYTIIVVIQNTIGTPSF